MPLRGKLVKQTAGHAHGVLLSNEKAHNFNESQGSHAKWKSQSQMLHSVQLQLYNILEVTKI